eukprot:3388949-Rhodomonas_salina.1
MACPPILTCRKTPPQCDWQRLRPNDAQKMLFHHLISASTSKFKFTSSQYPVLLNYSNVDDVTAVTTVTATVGVHVYSEPGTCHVAVAITMGGVCWLYD